VPAIRRISYDCFEGSHAKHALDEEPDMALGVGLLFVPGE
jgi:hypothetical protein